MAEDEAPGGSSPQNTEVQILTIDTRVRTPTSAATTNAHQAPDWAEARMSRNLARKPPNGGRPASDSAAPAKVSASNG